MDVNKMASRYGVKMGGGLGPSLSSANLGGAFDASRASGAPSPAREAPPPPAGLALSAAIWVFLTAAPNPARPLAA
eukprot:SAG11_NODE_19272_length_470_cov_1.247978_1_plen_76_part_10